MKHSEVVAAVEKAFLSGDIEIVAVHTVGVDGEGEGSGLKAERYAYADVRVRMPVKTQ